MLGSLIACNSNEKALNEKNAHEQSTTIVDTIDLPGYIQDYDDSLRNPVSEYFLTDLPLRSVAALIMADSLMPSDNIVTMRIIDSATGENAGSRAYYFKALNKIAFKSDGALSEILGDYLIDFVGKYTEEFATQLKTMNADEKSTWVYFMSRELAFRLENEHLVSTWTKALSLNCKTCNTEEKQVLDTFLQSLQVSVIEFMKDTHLEHEAG
jgi:hypothetical protein